MAIRGKNGRIPRYPIPMVNRVLVKESVKWDNTLESYNFTYLVAEECTVQRPKVSDLQILPQGLSIENLYVIYTNSSAYPPIDGTEDRGMSFYIPESITGAVGTGGWFSTVGLKPNFSEVIEHNKVFVAKDTTTLSDSGIEEYPVTQITAIESEINTKDKLRTSGWQTTWLANN